MPTLIEATDGSDLSSPIVLGVKRGDDGNIYGRIIATALPTMYSTFPEDPPIKEAVTKAIALANSHGITIIKVLDEEHLWDESWGHLYKE